MSLTVEIVSNIDTVEPAAWDRLVPPNNPFLQHGFLSALEETGCIGTIDTGWLPRHVLVRSNHELVAALPLYEKYDSYGEYIFDWGWSRSARMSGIPYYPKLVSAVPFTPVTGPRLLLADPAEASTLLPAVLAGVRKVADTINASSVHILFETEEERDALTEHGFHPRLSYQFHWHRAPGWQSFEDYLGAMRSSARKQIRKERAKASSHGLTIQTLRGPELTEEQWTALWSFYQITVAAKGAIPYLNQSFFEHIRHHFSDRVVASMAMRRHEPIAGALYFTAGDQLFGRYWGSFETLDALHFELCYYQPISWALTHGISHFEAGAQGEHKLKRGLLPTACYSSHWIQHPGLASAVQDFVQREELAIRRDIDLLAGHSPYRVSQEQSHKESHGETTS